MEDKKPFIDITGDNCTVEDCDFIGNRPTVKTSGKNTRLIRLKHFNQEIKAHPWRTSFSVGLTLLAIGLIIEYGFLV